MPYLFFEVGCATVRVVKKVVVLGMLIFLLAILVLGKVDYALNIAMA